MKPTAGTASTAYRAMASRKARFGLPAADAVPGAIIHRFAKLDPRAAPPSLMLTSMDAWTQLVAAALRRHGVGDPALAQRHGVTQRRFYDRTRRDGWHAPTHRVRVHPAAVPSVAQHVLVASCSTTALLAAASTTALWLLGIERRPPDRIEVAQQHASQAVRASRVRSQRARWLEVTDIRRVDGVPVLRPEAALISTWRASARQRRAWLIDSIHAGAVTATDVLRRLETVGPVPGRRVLYDAALDLEGRHIESVFHDDILEVLTARGYAPERSVGWIATADGRGLAPDIALPRWKVAVEAEGDSFHRTRDQRRTDRRRIAAYAATDWVVVPVDWRDWHRCQEFVLATIDAAIAGQRRRGIGRQHPAPPGV